MILDEIKKDNIQAIRDKNANARNIYSVVMNKALLETIRKREKGEALTDIDLVQILQKTIKELDEEAENYKKMSNEEQVKTIDSQKAVIEKYLPKMLSEKEIADIISKMEDKSMPAVMKKFKIDYAGKCDMRQVGEVLKRM